MKRAVERLLLRLADRGRIPRFSDPQSGLSLEKRLEPEKSVDRQKRPWTQAFLALIERELGPANGSRCLP